jgi:hypothetical protein
LKASSPKLTVDDRQYPALLLFRDDRLNRCVHLLFQLRLVEFTSRRRAKGILQ